MVILGSTYNALAFMFREEGVKPMNLVCIVRQKDGSSLSKLLNSAVSFNWHEFNFDRNEGLISFEHLDRSEVDNVIKLLDEVFIFDDIHMDFSDEKPSSKQVQTRATQNKTSSLFIINDADDLKYLRFNDVIANYNMFRLHKAIFNAIHHGFATPEDIWKFLLAARREIVITYNPPETIDFAIGDVVLCNYGTHVDGEVSGSHVASIVCDISDDGTAYVIPITKHIFPADKTKYLPVEVGSDIVYDDPNFAGGTLLLQKGKYVRAERFTKVIGKTSPEFLCKLLSILPVVYDFSINLIEFDM